MTFGYFDTTLQGRYVRFLVTTFHSYAAMRAGVLTCASEGGCNRPSCDTTDGRMYTDSEGLCQFCETVANAPTTTVYNCTSASDSTFTSNCNSGYYKDSTGTSDSCVTCSVVGNATSGANYTCTTASDSRVTACETGYYKVVGSTGSPDMCQPCAVVANSLNTSTLTCTSGSDSEVTACATGYYKTSTPAADTCTSCVVVTNAASGATYTCTSASDSQVSACATGYSKVTSSSANTCEEPDDSGAVVWLWGTPLATFLVMVLVFTASCNYVI